MIKTTPSSKCYYIDKHKKRWCRGGNNHTMYSRVPLLSFLLLLLYFLIFSSLSSITLRNVQEDGGGIGRGDHFLSYKFIERTIAC